MPKTKKRSGENKNMDVQELSLTVARRVLQDLLEQHPELRTAVAEIIENAMNNPRMEDIAHEIEGALACITADNIYARSGRTASGYREPEEAAADVLHEAMEKYFERVHELFRKKDKQNVLIVCEAIIFAMYRLKKSDHFAEFEEYAEYYPEETAGWTARLWRAGGNEDKASARRYDFDETVWAAFVQKYVPEWDWLLDED